MAEEEHDFFSGAVQNRTDATERYLNRTALVREIIGNSQENAGNYRRVIRQQLEDPHNGRLGKFAELDHAYIDEVRSWQRRGLIGAVDGTDSIRQTLLPDKIVYGVAISTVTSKLQTPPKIRITYTHKQQKLPDTINDIFALQESLEDAGDKASWMRTYREFEEREAALEMVASGCRLVLIDGPVYTQNLLTQGIGRSQLLDRVNASPENFIGYIKEQNAFHKHLGAALDQGEYFVFDRFKELLTHNRFRDQEQHPAVGWLKKAGHWIRCIYRLNQKAYEFECDPSLVPHGLAMVLVDRSDALHHDIPYLLELVDRCARGTTDAANIGRDLVQALGPFALAFEHEREFR